MGGKRQGGDGGGHRGGGRHGGGGGGGSNKKHKYMPVRRDSRTALVRCTSLPVQRLEIAAASRARRAPHGPDTQSPKTSRALPEKARGLIITCDNGREERTLQELTPVVEEVRAPQQRSWGCAARSAQATGRPRGAAAMLLERNARPAPLCSTTTSS